MITATSSDIKARQLAWKTHGAMALLVAAIMVVSAMDPAFASAGGGLQKLETAASKVVQFFTGAFGRSLGAIAFIGMFLAAAFGYWSWGALLRVGGAVAGIFAAAELVSFLA
jgi:type IV secretion system protein VirB2